MKQTTSQTEKLIESWELPEHGEKLYAADAVIEAYIKGKKEGLEHKEKLFFKQLTENLDKSGANTKKTIECLKSIGVTPLSAHLKANSFHDFYVLVTVSEEDFLKESFIKAYDFTEELEQSTSEDLYSISFSFINKTPHFNEKALSSDGFIFTFKQL